MGSEEDPTDGAAVAASVFGAVAIYGVCPALLRQSSSPCTDSDPGLPRLLRWPSLFAPTRQIKRRHCPVIDLYLVPCSSRASQATHIFDNLTSRYSTSRQTLPLLLFWRGVSVSSFEVRLLIDTFCLGGNLAQYPCVYLSSICCKSAVSLHIPSCPVTPPSMLSLANASKRHQPSRPNIRNHHHSRHHPWASAICSCMVRRASIPAWRSSCVLRHQR